MDAVSRSRKPCYFVSIMSGGLEICESRQAFGLPAIVINAKTAVEKSNTNNKCLPFLPHLEGILSRVYNNNLPVLYNFVEDAKSGTYIRRKNLFPFSAVTLSIYLPRARACVCICVVIYLNFNDGLDGIKCYDYLCRII